MKTQLLRPGFMVCLKSKLVGGTEYQVHEQDTQQEGATLKKRRDSTTIVYDVDEHERAVKVRGAATYMISRHCVKTPFTLLCPKSNSEELDRGMAEAKQLVEDFNASSVYTKISLYVLKGVLLGDDEENARAIAAEVRSLLAETEAAIKRMDPEAIREAITKANEVSAMLVEEQQEKIAEAIKLARTAAREIKKTIKNKGEGAINVLTDYRVELKALEVAKNSFLDFEEPKGLSPDQEAPAVQVKELDLSEDLTEQYSSPEECKKAGMHNRSVDNDGYCNACGCKETNASPLPTLDL